MSSFTAYTQHDTGCSSFRAFRQVNEIKGIQPGKKEVKLPLSADDIILYIKNYGFLSFCFYGFTPKNKLSQLINNLSKIARDNDINTQKSTVFLYSSNESKNEIKKNNSIYSDIKKRIK